MKNIELKVKVKELGSVLRLLPEIRAKKAARLLQVDTYFKIRTGARLKTREINRNRFELIYYKRPDLKISKLSVYQVVVLNSQNIREVKSLLTVLFGVLVIVKKERNFWMYKHTRVYLDKVMGLGNFVELETVIKNIKYEDAVKEHKEVIRLLRLDKYKKIPVSYSDLLLKK